MDKRDEIQRIRDEREKWEKSVLAPLLKSHPERMERFRTTSGIEVKRVYTPEDLEGFDYVRDLGFPGSYPFTRGVYPTGYRGQLWTRRQVTGFRTPEETNRRLKWLAQEGQTGLNIVFDMPTHHHIDSDHPLAHGEVGKEGVPIDSLRDYEVLFEGIDLEKVSTSLITSGPVQFAMYLALARKRGVPFHMLRGSLQNDILLPYHSVNVFVFPIECSAHTLADIVEYCSMHLPRWNTMTIAGYNFREAGGSAVMEIADCLSTAMAYIDLFLKRGLDIDFFAPRIAFFLSAHNDFFEEIAKFRAMRRMWARIMKERYGAKDPRSYLMRFHTQTAGSTLTAQQPENNIIRTTIQALAAVLGGTQSLHTNSYDEALGLPTEDAARIALRTQQIIAHESGVTNTVDPLGGSYFVESLTNALEEKAWEMIRDIEKEGGMFEAVKKGIIQKMKDDFAQGYFREIERGERIVVGVNQYCSEEKPQIKVFRISPRYEREQVKNLKKIRKERDEKRVRDALSRLKDAHRRRENTIEATIEAALAYATVGEIAASIQEVWGEAKEPDVNVKLYLS